MYQPREVLETLNASQDVSEWIKRDGFLIVFGSIVLIFGVIFMVMWLKNYWSHVQNDCRDHKQAKDLLNHSFFGTMEVCLKTKVLCLNLPEKGREAIFRDFLKIEFQVFMTNIYTWLVKHQSTLDLISPESLHNEMLLLIADSVAEYEDKALKLGIPTVVVDKFRKFHSPHIEAVVTSIYNICQCEWIVATNTEKLGFILNNFTHVFDTTLVVDAEIVLRDINGELDGVVYRGITVQPFKHMKKEASSFALH